jgi:hypothetical protein
VQRLNERRVSTEQSTSTKKLLKDPDFAGLGPVSRFSDQNIWIREHILDLKAMETALNNLK